MWARAPLLAIALSLAAGCGSETAETRAEIGAEAGFIEIEPVDYTLHGSSTPYLATSSRARLFYSFHPADEAPEDRPLMVVYSGGPGASTGILLGGNTAPMTVDPARTGDRKVVKSTSSWTAFANVLHVDARGAGLSYGIAPGASDPTIREDEITERNFNPWLDAADIVRVVLRFLDAHPTFARSRVVMAGESYGGLRTEVALHLLLHPERYETGSAIYLDAALAKEIRAHFASAGTTAKEQFDRAVLLQPRLTSPEQQAAAGASLEAEGSPIYVLDPSVGYIPCKDKSIPCSSYPNVVEYLTQLGRDIYDVRKPAGDEFARYAALGERLADPPVLGQVLGQDPDGIAKLRAGERGDAYRLVDPDPTAEPLDAVLGDLPPHDRYFEMELFELIGAPFVSSALVSLGLERTNSRYGRLFLEDLLDVRVFITNAAFDAAIWTPSLPDALAMYTSDVAGVHKGDEAFTLDFVPGAFDAPAGTSRTVTFPTYAASGHSIALDEPDKLADDIAAFLRASE